MTPTAMGRQCSRCQTEVVDFTRMSEAEVLAFMAAQNGRRVCAFMLAPAVAPRHPKRISGVRCWLLAVAAFLSGQHVSALVLPPQPLPANASAQKQTVPSEAIVIRGVVLDDSLNVPVRGAYVFISGTEYGAITDEKGEFTLSFTTDWLPVKGRNSVRLDIPYIAFTFKPQTVEVSFPNPAPISIRLHSVPTRGYKGKAIIKPAPLPLPSMSRQKH